MIPQGQSGSKVTVPLPPDILCSHTRRALIPALRYDRRCSRPQVIRLRPRPTAAPESVVFFEGSSGKHFINLGGGEGAKQDPQSKLPARLVFRGDHRILCGVDLLCRNGYLHPFALFSGTCLGTVSLFRTCFVWRAPCGPISRATAGRNFLNAWP